jgi:hypothetical protein
MSRKNSAISSALTPCNLLSDIIVWTFPRGSYGVIPAKPNSRLCSSVLVALDARFRGHDDMMRAQ